MSCLAMHKKQAVNENPMYYAQNLLPSSSGCRTFFIVAYKIAALRHCRKKAETLTAWIMLKLTMLTHSKLIKHPNTHDLHIMLSVPFSQESITSCTIVLKSWLRHALNSVQCTKTPARLKRWRVDLFLQPLSYFCAQEPRNQTFAKMKT